MNNIIFPVVKTQATVTSYVTYDGVTLSIGFSSGNVNALAVALSNAITALGTSITNLTIDTDHSVLLHVNTNCLSLVDGNTLTAAINAMLAQICSTKTSLADLNTDGVEINGVVTIPNCLTITNGMTLTQAVNLIISKYCTLSGNSILITDHISGGSYKTPFISYSKATVVCTDNSGGGVIKVTFGSQSYFVDDRNVTQISQDVVLTDNSDNYIFLDNTNSWSYAVSHVAVSAAAPTTTGVQIVKVTVISGAISTITILIPYYPIDNSFLADGSVQARNLNSNTVDTAGAIIQNAGAYKSNTDNSTIEIASNKLQVKKVYKGNMDSGIAGVGLIQNNDGSFSPSAGRSIQIYNGNLVLVGDSATRPNNSHYGLNSSGGQGFIVDMLIDSGWIQVPSLSTIGTTPYVNANPLQNIKEIIITGKRINTGWSFATATTIDFGIAAGGAPTILLSVPVSILETNVSGYGYNTFYKEVVAPINNNETYNNIVIKTNDLSNPTGGDYELWYKVIYEPITMP